MIDPGALRDSITIQRATLTPDVYGAQIEEWQDYATVRAMVADVRGVESTGPGQIRAVSTMAFTIRREPGVTSAMRIIFKGKKYGILEIISLDVLGFWSKITASEILDG